jgi:hypothetical protein
MASDITSSSAGQSPGAAHLPKWWRMRPGPERAAAKAASEVEHPIKRIGPVGFAVCEYAQNGRPFMRGGSGWAHYFHDESSRACAIMLARSKWKRLPLGIKPVLVNGQLALAAGDNVFPVISDLVISFDTARAEALANLESTRASAPAASSEITSQGEVSND